MAEPLWRLDGVRVGRRLVLDHLAIPAGLTAVMGPSGAGKTTLLDLLAGFQRAEAGRLVAHLPGGTPPLFWSPQGGDWPHLGVADQLAAVGGRDAGRLLAAFHLAPRAAARPGELSAGERERLSVARALASGAPVLVLDEPFAHLDPDRAQECWEVLLALLRERGAHAVYATHQAERVVGVADHLVLLREGRLGWQGPPDEAWHRPPDPQVAACLGPANWLAAAEAGLVPGAAPGCLRPERLAVAADAAGGAVVLAAACHGPLARLELDHGGERRAWWLRAAALPAVGTRVALRLAALLCIIGLGGCGGDPLLAVAEERTWSLTPDGGALPAPRGACAAPGGGATVLDTAGRVQTWDAQGRLGRHWRMPAWDAGRPEGAVWLADGRLAVADTHYHRVVLFRADGALDATWGGEGDAPGSFRWPVGACSDAAGRLYISEYGGNDRVTVFAPDGRALRTIGGFGTAPGCFQRPQSLCWDDGVLYVADTMNNRIQAFRDDGAHLAVLGAGAGLRFPYGIALLADRTLLVAEYAGGRLSRFARDGRLLGRHGGPGREVGCYDTPWGLCVDRDGLAWICDTGNRRLALLRLHP